MIRIGLSSLQSRLAAADNRPSGFDYMRLILATLVVATHATNVCYGMKYTLDVWAGPWRMLLAIILPMFFALSGFLVAGSLQRCRSLISFLGLRTIRLLPALAVDTLVGALIIGPLFTAMPLADYFSDPTFAAYFLNIVGDIHYTLPGVFAENPWPHAVNQQLGTLPFEMICYASLAGLAFVGAIRHRKFYWPFVVTLNIFLFVYFTLIKGAVHGSTVSFPTLVQCFLYGIGLYLYRDKIAWSPVLGALSLIATLACLTVPSGDYLAPLPAAYFTAYLGLMQPKRIRLISTGDYSYGIFLYGFPVQQAVVAVMGSAGTVWYANLLFSFPITFCLAVFSWWCVEKPALSFKSHLLRLEERVLNLSALVPGGRYLFPPIMNTPLPPNDNAATR